jgi:PBP1b-binding outer membrane lipoprotein LpoB
MNSKIAIFVSVLLLSFLLFGCSQQPPAQQPPPPGTEQPALSGNDVATPGEDAGLDSSLSDLDALEAESPDLSEDDINTSIEDSEFDSMLADLDALNES